MDSISVVITAYNEEKNIGACLESVKNFADEIIVVDNSSSDQTAKIAKNYTKNIFLQQNDPLNIDLQKNFGFTKASKRWILSLDADELVTKELIEEIRSLPDTEDGKVAGYLIPRKNIIFGKWIRHSGWYPDFQLRLFKKGKGRYTNKHVHEQLEVIGKVAELTGHLLHNHYTSVSQFVNRSMNVYVPNEAEEKLKNGYTYNPLDIIRFPFQEFLSRFFSRKGYKDGIHGLALALLMSWYHFMVFMYIWEKHKYVDKGNEKLLDQIENEGKKMHEQFMYWIITEKIAATKNKGKKYILKIQRKLQ